MRKLILAFALVACLFVADVQSADAAVFVRAGRTRVAVGGFGGGFGNRVFINNGFGFHGFHRFGFTNNAFLFGSGFGFNTFNTFGVPAFTVAPNPVFVPSGFNTFGTFGGSYFVP